MGKNLTPVLSVILPAYNAAEYVETAINSILEQTFTNFELIVINDGSSDGTEAIIKKWAAKDTRLKLLSQENMGLVASLNRGINEARAALIARHDADDLSDPSRFIKQVRYLHQNPETVLVGSSMKVMNDAGDILHEHAVLINEPELKHELLVRSPFPHGSVMFRRNQAVLAGLYKAEAWPAEDYDFWVRLSAYGNFANIDECLYVYRENTHGISASRHEDQVLKASQARDQAWNNRRRLLSGKSITLNDYTKRSMGAVRQERILDNIRSVHARAAAEHDLWTLINNARLVAGNSMLYRRKIGTIKRKMKRT